MHYPDAAREYEEALAALGKAIKTARAGDYRRGYLSILLEGLNMVKGVAHKVGRLQRDGQMLDSLIAECREALEMKEGEEGASPLAELFEELEEAEEAAEGVAGDPPYRHTPVRRPGVGR